MFSSDWKLASRSRFATPEFETQKFRINVDLSKNLMVR